MIFDFLAPPPGPRGRDQKCAVARLIHVTNSHTKFGWISSNGLGGDSVMDRRTDGGDCNIPNAFLKKRGDNEVSCLLKFVQLIWLFFSFIGLWANAV